MRNEPDLKNAENLTLKESNENIARMKPMEPMRYLSDFTKNEPGMSPAVPSAGFSFPGFGYYGDPWRALKSYENRQRVCPPNPLSHNSPAIMFQRKNSPVAQ